MRSGVGFAHDTGYQITGDDFVDWVGRWDLDITENIVFNAFRGITPWRIFQFIVSV